MKKLLQNISMMLLAATVATAPAFATNAPTAKAGAPVALAETDDDEDDPEPYIEPAFTVTINIDNADAVYFTVNDKPISHTAGDNEVTVDPGDGYIKVHVNDGYVFTKFTDDTAQSDYLQYDTQKMPVTIRKVLSTGADEGVIVDGHYFTVKTFDTTQYATFTLTVEVDDASLTDMCVGAGIDPDSNANRKVDLRDGTNTVTYTEADKYLHVRGQSFMSPLQSVTFNGKAVASDGQMNAVYTIPLNGAKTQNGVVVVTAKKPVVEEPYSITVVVDDVENIRFFTKMPDNVDLTLENGENTVKYKEGDYFQIWGPKAYSCTFEGTEIEYTEMYGSGIYTVTPTDGGTLDIKYNEPEPVGPHFTIFVDDASQVSKFFNTNTGDAYTLENGLNVIDMEDEDDNSKYRITTKDKVQAFSFTLDGANVSFSKKGGNYDFTPSNGSEVVVYFSEPVTEYNFTLNVDDASRVTVHTGTKPLDDCLLTLNNGLNALKVGVDNPKIRIAPALNSRIVSVTDGEGKTYEADAEAIHYVPVTEGLALDVKTAPNEPNGVENVACDSESHDVYNLQGMLVKRGNDAARQLPAGVYIVNGRKVLVR